MIFGFANYVENKIGNDTQEQKKIRKRVLARIKKNKKDYTISNISPSIQEEEKKDLS